MKKGMFLLFIIGILFASIGYAVDDDDRDGVPNVDDNGNIVDICPNSDG